MNRIFGWLFLIDMLALSGCVVHDGKQGAEPMWWPTFVVRESTSPALLNYTSPGPGDQAVGLKPLPDDPKSPFRGS
jgi:hypothetical protein